jgi:YD repeat-containing protein
LTCFETLSYTYDDKGRILKEENSDGSVSYEYDAWGKCVSTVTVHDNDFETKLARNIKLNCAK